MALINTKEMIHKRQVLHHLPDVRGTKGTVSHNSTNSVNGDICTLNTLKSTIVLVVLHYILYIPC